MGAIETGLLSSFTAEDIVDDDLQGPRLKELEAGDQKDLGQCPQEAPP